MQDVERGRWVSRGYNEIGVRQFHKWCLHATLHSRAVNKLMFTSNMTGSQSSGSQVTGLCPGSCGTPFSSFMVEHQGMSVVLYLCLKELTPRVPWCRGRILTDLGISLSKMGRLNAARPSAAQQHKAARLWMVVVRLAAWNVFCGPAYFQDHCSSS